MVPCPPAFMHILRRLRRRRISYGRAVLRHGQPPGQAGAYVRSPRTGAVTAQPQRPERRHAPQPPLFHPAFPRSGGHPRHLRHVGVRHPDPQPVFDLCRKGRYAPLLRTGAPRPDSRHTRRGCPDAYAEMCIGFYRLGHQYDLAENLRLAHEVYDWSNTPPEEPENIYQRTKRLLLRGYANLTLCYHEGGNRRAYIPQTDTWREAYELTEQMPNLNIRRCFASIIYYVLSGAYNQSYPLRRTDRAHQRPDRTARPLLFRRQYPRAAPLPL